MLEAIKVFFTTMDFMPHGHCFLWRKDILIPWVISDSFIALSYFTIPFGLYYILKKRNDIPNNKIVWLFVLFIVSCGINHAFGIYTLWNPKYNYEVVLKSITAMASITTAAYLWVLMPGILAIPSRKQLEELTENLEVKNKELELFSNLTAHDLRSPIKNIVNLSQVARIEIEEGIDTAQINDYFYEIEKKGRKLDEMIETFRKLTKMKLDDLHMEPVKIKDLIEESIDNDGLKIEYIAPESEVMVDRKSFYIVISNLLRNVVAHGSSPRISVECNINGDQAELRFLNEAKDKSITESATRFLPFAKGQESQGLGLGLSICNKIVEHHDGLMSRERKHGKYIIKIMLPNQKAIGGLNV